MRESCLQKYCKIVVLDSAFLNLTQALVLNSVLHNDEKIVSAMALNQNLMTTNLLFE